MTHSSSSLITCSYERNLAELHATMAALNASNAALQAASERLAEEQARSDALLYQMLPRVVADKLRRGALLTWRCCMVYVCVC